MSEEKNKPQEQTAVHQEYPYTVSVKFRNADKAYTFGTRMPQLKAGDKVVVETAQGMEIGECTGDSLSTETSPSRLVLKPVLRVADEQDLQDDEENQENSEEAFKVCEEEIKKLNLDMHLLSAEYTLDRRKALFVYMAEQRVDFRDLLKHLSQRLGCRIELRQIGERDKAKMVGGVGICGMECCCSRFKSHFDTISINMAKNQLLALNIDKLSGQCGKLMCCLKYEDQDYKELTQGLPKMGAQVEYEGAIYRVTGMNVMANSAKLENRETYQFITLDELKEKGIVRKGVQMKKKDPNHPQVNGKADAGHHARRENGPVMKENITRIQPSGLTSVPSMNLMPAMHAEVQKPQAAQSNQNNQVRQNAAQRNPQKQENRNHSGHRHGHGHSQRPNGAGMNTKKRPDEKPRGEVRSFHAKPKASETK